MSQQTQNTEESAPQYERFSSGVSNQNSEHSNIVKDKTKKKEWKENFKVEMKKFKQEMKKAGKEMKDGMQSFHKKLKKSIRPNKYATTLSDSDANPKQDEKENSSISFCPHCGFSVKPSGARKFCPSCGGKF